jgi:hypothetical protein
MLAQFALIVFAIFAVMSLVTDFGYVTLTRVLMQNAADAAVIEAVRQRDNGVESDSIRRGCARNFVRWMFDDDLDATLASCAEVPPDSGDERSFGAGPVLEFDPDPGAGGDLNALQKVSRPDPHVYDPDLQLNFENAPYGDLVSGREPLMPPTCPTTFQHPECPDYTRADFEASSDVPQPGLPIADDLFLVRLRRTNDFDGLDEIEGVSSRGPAVPLLFGRGAAISADPDATYSPRVHGITVRATAIAQALPALTAGPPATNVPGFEELGVASFDIHRAFAERLVTPQAATIDSSDGTIRVGAIPCDAMEPDNCGRFITVPASLVAAGDLRLSAGGAASCDPLATPEANTISGYAPVYDVIGASATQRVIGFVRLALSWPDCAAAPESIVLTLLGRVAPANATATLPNGWPDPADLSPADRSEILLKNRALNDPSTGVQVALLAPVLVR